MVLHAGDAVRVSAPTMGHLHLGIVTAERRSLRSLLSEHVLSKAKLKVDTQAPTELVERSRRAPLGQVGLPRIVLDLQEASPKETLGA